MAYWLVKSEPGTWSWDDQVRDKSTGWTGVRNFQATNHMKDMRKGDHAFFYHSGDERQVVGIVRIIKEYHPDPTDKEGRFGMVDVEADRPMKTPVTLAAIKADPRLADMVLVRNSRLSVQPVEPAAWKIVCGMGGVKA